MSDRMEPPFDSCPTCEGHQGRAVWLPGDGTSAMESVWVDCADCEGTGRRIEPPFNSCRRCGTPPTDTTLEYRGADGHWRWTCDNCGQINWPAVQFPRRSTT